jgi:glycosyltransferase involved in cell wall biosynthesis
MNLAHVSLFKREHRGHYSPGGVEKFAHLLQQAIPDLQILSTQDMQTSTQESVEPWKLAEMMNAELLERKLLDENSVVVGDGFWIAGLAGKVARLISVCHGSYIGTAIEHEKYPFDEPHVGEWGLIQEEIWRDDRVEVVAVSNRAQWELKRYCDIDSYVIEHGIPLDIYRPPPKGSSHLVLHVATSERKGRTMVETVKAYDKFKIEQLGFASGGDMEAEARLWQRGGIFFQPTKYEGGSYATLEALACGLVPVTYYTGQACDLPCDVGLVTDDYHEHRFLMMIEEVSEFYSNFFPREWAMENCTFDRFAKRWKSYLEMQ